MSVFLNEESSQRLSDSSLRVVYDTLESVLKTGGSRKMSRHFNSVIGMDRVVLRPSYHVLLRTFREPFRLS